MKKSLDKILIMNCFVIIIVLFVSARCNSDAPSISKQYRFTRSRVCTLKKGVVEDSFRFNRDGKKSAFIFREGGKCQVMWNNTAGESFESINSVEISETGLHCMYWGFKDSKVFLLRNHKVLGSWPVASKDSLDRCWCIIGPGDHHWIAEGVADATNVSDDMDLFLKRIEAAAKGVPDPTNLIRIVDGQEQSKGAILGPVVFSKEGRSWGYTALDDQRNLVFIVNGKEVRRISGCGRIAFLFSLIKMIINEEGEIVAAVEPRVGGYQVRRGKDVVAEFATALYVQDKKLLTVVGIESEEKEIPPEHQRYIYPVSLQCIAGHLLWVQNVEGKYFVHEVVLDGKPIGPKIHAETNAYLNRVVPVFCSRGEAVAFEGRDEAGKWFVWSTNRFKSGYIGAINPQLSSDGKHLAFITGELKDGEMQTVYVVDDRQLKLEGYGNVTAGRFSPDGVVFCFVAETKGKKSKLLIEQTVCAEFDGMVQVAPILKRPDSTLWYIVKQGKELYRLELEKAS